MKNLFPIPKNFSAKTIGEDLIGMRPDETWTEAVNRHILEQRKKKITKIFKNINMEEH